MNLEESFEGAQKRCVFVGGAFFSKRLKRRVEHFVDESIEGLRNFFDRFGANRVVGQSMAEAVEFGLLDLLSLLAQSLDRRAGLAMLDVADKANRFFADDPLGNRPLQTTEIQIAIADFLQIVNRIEIDLGKLSDALIEISRNRQVKNELRPLFFAAVVKGLIGFKTHDRLAGGRRTDNQIGQHQTGSQSIPVFGRNDQTTVKLLVEGVRDLSSAIG